MNLIDQITADQLTARKTRDKIAATVLTTLIGEATKIPPAKQLSKDEYVPVQNEITDDKVRKAIIKFVKGATETKNILLEAKNSDSKIDGLDERIATATREIEILMAYLPDQMSEDEIRSAIASFKDQNPDANMGQVMVYLKTNFDGKYDAKLASQMVKG